MATPFRWLCIVMHIAVVALLVFVSEVISIFGNMVSKAESAMPQVTGQSISAFTTFNLGGLGLLHTMVIPLVIVFTISNSIAPAIVEGGSRYKVFSNLWITASISGICLVFIPYVAQMLFSSVKL